MVWFQCEDCGENLKKPKLVSHFRICSANKLSCIDCGEMFGQQSVQGHTQCITEAEKYGPKGHGKASNNTPAKTNKDSKPKPDVDINVGLSLRQPWFCSLCNTSATSKQTLLLHAEGKKHRAKARAFHASKQQSKETEGSTPNTKDVAAETQNAELVSKKDEAAAKEQNLLKPTFMHNNNETENGSLSSKKKRKLDASDDGSTKSKEDADNLRNASNGEVIQAKRAKEGSEGQVKKTEHTVASVEEKTDTNGNTKEYKHKKIKWKKLIASVLKSNSDGTMKIRKLEKAVIKSLQAAGHVEDDDELKEKLIHKINSSSRFRLNDKFVCLVAKS